MTKTASICFVMSEPRKRDFAACGVEYGCGDSCAVLSARWCDD